MCNDRRWCCNREPWIRPTVGVTTVYSKRTERSDAGTRLQQAKIGMLPDGVGVAGRYSNRQITQLAAQLLDWSLEEGPLRGDSTARRSARVHPYRQDWDGRITLRRQKLQLTDRD